MSVVEMFTNPSKRVNFKIMGRRKVLRNYSTLSEADSPVPSLAPAFVSPPLKVIRQSSGERMNE